MVIHANIDAVSPSATLLQSKLAPKKYVVVKNHVREITKSNDNTPLEKCDNSKEITEEKVTRKRKSKSSVVNQTLQNIEDNDQNSVTCQIDQSDLEELRKVYLQCKSVINKIETKYGHLLNLNSYEESKLRQNKIIVFNEDGQEFLKDMSYDEKHFCFNELKPVKRTELQIKYRRNTSSGLPDSLKELSELLAAPIDYRLRSFVINKMKGLKRYYLNEIKENKRFMVKKLKENPPEVLLGFEGTNLSTISGYPD